MLANLAQAQSPATPPAVDSAVGALPLPIVPDAQKDNALLESGVSKEIYTIVEEPARFSIDVAAYLRDKIVYPTSARQKELTGRAIIRFIIDAEGTVLNPEVVRSAGDAALDAEATRVIRSMPRWTPGKLQGKAVATYFSLPVDFRLDPETELPARK